MIEIGPLIGEHVYVYVVDGVLYERFGPRDHTNKAISSDYMNDGSLPPHVCAAISLLDLALAATGGRGRMGVNFHAWGAKLKGVGKVYKTRDLYRDKATSILYAVEVKNDHTQAPTGI